MDTKSKTFVQHYFDPPFCHLDFFIYFKLPFLTYLKFDCIDLKRKCCI